jgi:membrane protein YdbS with pleckstrin-like domain
MEARHGCHRADREHEHGDDERMSMRTRRGARTSSMGAVLLIVWLVIGAIAAAQRGYFTSDDTSCATVGTTIVTVLAGPLNYVGANPHIQCPQPST